MKKTIISLITMAMASFGFAQNPNPGFDLSGLRDITILDSGSEYLNNVQSDIAPNRVKYLEHLVSYWDVNGLEKFDGRKGESFSITFKLEDGYIMASYDNNGKVVSAIERFSNFALPKTVSKEVLQHYPDWKIIKNRYSVWYGRNNRTKRTFKLLIRKGSQKKWLKVDSTGSIS